MTPAGLDKKAVEFASDVMRAAEEMRRKASVTNITQKLDDATLRQMITDLEAKLAEMRAALQEEKNRHAAERDQLMAICEALDQRISAIQLKAA